MIRMKSTIYIPVLFLVIGIFINVSDAGAQAVFVTKGKIEYEKKVNMQKYIEDNSWTSEFKDKMPVYKINYYNLFFDSAVTIFKAGREVPDDKWKNFWSESGADENVVKMDYSGGIYSEFKQVFEKRYLVQDSMIQIEWKLSDEYRTIAGFDCRKAVGRFFDSLYVIAFYTDQIPLPGGPEQFNGLPGVILGLALPRYYTTWFATKVELETPAANELKLPEGKASRISRRQLMEQVVKVFEWGSEEEKQKSFWNIIL
jgi:GLPGLI family protein